MTRFALADIPPSAQLSLEALAVWAIEVLEYNSKGATCIESVDPTTRQGVPTRCAQNIDRYNDAVDPPEYRHIGRLSLQLLPEYISGPSWNYVKTINDLPVPDFLKK